MGYVAWEKNFSSLQIRSSYEIKLKYFKVLLFTSLFKKKILHLGSSYDSIQQLEQF